MKGTTPKGLNERGSRSNLTHKQENFCQMFIETGNASEAYRRSYNVMPNTKEATVNRTAWELYNSPKISARIRELQTELKKTSDIKKEALLEELACIAFADIRDYVIFDGTRIKFKSFDELTDRQARAIESMKETRYGVELKLHGKSWSIERISKMLGFDTPEDINLKLEKLSDEDLDTVINKLLKKEDK